MASTGIELATAWVSIVPSTRGLRQGIAADLNGAEKDAAAAGRRYGKAFGDNAATAADKALARLRSNADAAGAAAASASQRLAAARRGEADAIGRVRAAEAQLASARASSGSKSAQAVRAEESLAAARRRSEQASESVSAAAAGVEAAQRRAAAAAKELESAQTRTGAAAEKSTRGFARFGSGAKAAFAGAMRAAAPFVGLMAGVSAGQFFGDAIRGASDLEQSIGAVDAVFKAQAGSIKAAGADAAANLGLTKSAYNDLAASLGALLKNKGISDFTGETQNLIKTGADLAAQFGGTTQQAVEALGSALRGETDPIERYGVTMNEAAIQAQALAMGLGAPVKNLDEIRAKQNAAVVAQHKYNDAVRQYGTDSDQAMAAEARMITAQAALAKSMEGKKQQLTDQEKAMAALALVQKQTTDAQGAAAREQDTYAGRVARLTAAWGNFKATIGGPLIGALAAVMGVMTSVVTAVDGLFAGITGGAGQVGALRAAFDALAASPVGQWFAGLVADIAGVLSPALAEIGEVITGTVWPAMQSLGQALQSAARAFLGFADAIIGSPVGQFLTTLFKGVILGLVTGVKDIFVGLVKVVSGAFAAVAALLTGDWPRMWSGLGQVVVGAVQALWGVLQAGLMGRVLGLFRGFATAATMALSGLGAFTSGLLRGLASGFVEFGGTLGRIAGAVIGPAVRAVGATFSALGGLASAAVARVVAVFTSMGARIGSTLGVAEGSFAAFRASLVGTWNTVVAATTGAWNTVVGRVFSPMQQLVAGVLIAAWNGFGGSVSATWSTVAAAAQAGWARVSVPLNTMRQWMTAVLPAAYTAWRASWAAAWANAWATLTGAWTRFLGVFGQFRQWLTAVLPAAGQAFLSSGRAVWSAFTNVVAGAYGATLGRVFTPLRSWLSSTLPGALGTFRTAVTTVWNAAASAIGSAWTRMNRTFTSLKDGVQSVWRWFQVAVSGIGKTWDTLSGAITTPVKYVVNNVIRDKLIGAWNAVSSRVGLPTFQFAGMYAGGPVAGWSPNDKADNIPAMLTADEFVTRRRSARKMRRRHPGALEYINRYGELPPPRGYARGGWAKPWPMAVGAYIKRMFPGTRGMGGYGERDGYSDHGTGNALDVMVPDSSPLGDAIAAWGVQNRAALRLKYIIWKKRIIGSGQWDAGWRPYTRYGNSRNRTLQHYDHPHFSFQHDTWGDQSVLSKVLSSEMLAALKKMAPAGGGMSMSNPIAESLKAILGVPLGAARTLAGGVARLFGGTAWADIVGAVAKQPIDALERFLRGKIDSAFPPIGGGAADSAAPTSAGSGPVRSQVQEVASRHGWGSGPQWDAIQWIIGRESSWNPNAQNPRSTAYGLFQFLNGTWGSTGIGKTSNPGLQAEAGMRYIKSRYGSPAAARAFWQRNGYYSEGGTVRDNPRPQLFDTGGLLLPGTHLVRNATGLPETIRTFEQERALQARMGGPNITINGIRHDSVGEFAQALDYALIRARNISRYQTLGV